MEIEGPERPIRSLKDFLAYLLTVTLGVMIARGVEAWVEHQREQGLVREARHSLDVEIAENRAKVAKHQQKLNQLAGDVADLQDEVRIARRGGKPPGRTFDVGIQLTMLTSSAWETAAASQALAFMGIDELQRYTPIYTLQREFMAYQDRSIDSWLDTLAVLTDRQDGETGLPTGAAELAGLERRLSGVLLRTQVFLEIDKKLLDLDGQAVPATSGATSAAN